ncbi:cytochrome c oxidase assembly factor CtaG [Bacillus massiliigorillae]|uniref:cytochrome c oxidase assembly factor CtaG n=1 Tax=Bacillus massiliigorillae TaxID=1243664 RepID=UPI0003A5DCD8|nr:cytochrome c oxidase assembly factor CtaG [Bacillus massiliigorillae]
MTLEIFGFRALWSPFFLITILIVGILFFVAATVYRERLSNKSEKLTKTQAALFITVLVLLYIIKGSPIDLLGHIMFSVHMTQMAILYLVIPPLLIVAVPNWIWRSILSIRIIKSVFQFVTKPLIALIVFNGTFSFYHIPIIFDAVKTDMFLHALYTILLFFTAIFMWWPIINKLEEYQGFYGIKRIGYIFGNGILLTPACALIIFAEAPMYSTFSNPTQWLTAMELCVPASTLSGLNITGPEVFNTMPLLEDQKTGGIIMKIIQEIVYGVVLAHIFFQWSRQENVHAVDEIPAELQTSEIKPVQ